MSVQPSVTGAETGAVTSASSSRASRRDSASRIFDRRRWNDFGVYGGKHSH